MTAPEGVQQSTAVGADSFSEDLRALYGAVDADEEVHQGMGSNNALSRHLCMLDKAQSGRSAR